jgi:hypothetical protein
MKLRFSILALIIYLINSILAATDEECTSSNPTQKDDCYSKTTPTHYCCYKVNISDQGKSCVLKEKNLNDYSVITKVNGVVEYVDCGPIGAANSNTSNQPGQSEDKNENSLKLPNRVCGVFNPKEAQDCNSNSIFGNSCCFYQKEGDTGCYWLGRTYFGEASFDNMKVVCASCTLQIYGLLLLSLLFMILI